MRILVTLPVLCSIACAGGEPLPAGETGDTGTEPTTAAGWTVSWDGDEAGSLSGAYARWDDLGSGYVSVTLFADEDAWLADPVEGHLVHIKTEQGNLVTYLGIDDVGFYQDNLPDCLVTTDSLDLVELEEDSFRMDAGLTTVCPDGHPDLSVTVDIDR